MISVLNVFYNYGISIVSRYETMLRIQKRYRLNYKESRSTYQMVLGHDMTFTSYPGFLYSLDDFYLISSGLAVTETTNSVYNPQLWANIQPVGQVRDQNVSYIMCTYAYTYPTVGVTIRFFN